MHIIIYLISNLYLHVIPSPTWASCIMLTSLAPSPMAAVTGVWSATFISFTTYKVTAKSNKQSDWFLGQSQGHDLNDLSSTKENCFLGNYGYITYIYITPCSFI